MEYNVIWSEFAEQQIDEIFEFYKQKTKSKSVAKQLISKILLTPDRLKTNARIGQKEPALAKRNIEYRYILASHYKIIYSVDEKNGHIQIADVFDTRQRPQKIKRNKWKYNE